LNPDLIIFQLPNLFRLLGPVIVDYRDGTIIYSNYLPGWAQLCRAVVLCSGERGRGWQAILAEYQLALALFLDLLQPVLFKLDGLIEIETVDKVPIQHLGWSHLQRPDRQDPRPGVRRHERCPALVGLASALVILVIMVVSAGAYYLFLGRCRLFAAHSH